jgi:hypothetical protein
MSYQLFAHYALDTGIRRYDDTCLRAGVARSIR